MAEDRSFGPWGQARNADWSTPASPPPLTETPRGFGGHEHLVAVGLVHMNGRVYDPAIGRFMSPDPSDALNPGVGFNRYAYVKNNPVSFTDPSGFIAVSGTVAIATGLTITALAAAKAYDDWRKSPEGEKALRDLKKGLASLGGRIRDWIGSIKQNAREGWRNDPGASPPSGHNGPPGPLPCCPVDPGWFDGGDGGDIDDELGPTVGDLRAAGLTDAHHIVQDAAVRDLPGYDTNAAPGVQLEGPAKNGTPHGAATAVQRQPGGGTLGDEYGIAYEALRAAGYSHAQATEAVKRAARYFESLGHGPNTPTRIPGNRPASKPSNSNKETPEDEGSGQ